MRFNFFSWCSLFVCHTIDLNIIIFKMSNDIIERIIFLYHFCFFVFLCLLFALSLFLPRFSCRLVGCEPFEILKKEFGTSQKTKLHQIWLNCLILCNKCVHNQKTHFNISNSTASVINYPRFFSLCFECID